MFYLWAHFICSTIHTHLNGCRRQTFLFSSFSRGSGAEGHLKCATIFWHLSILHNPTGWFLITISLPSCPWFPASEHLFSTHFLISVRRNIYYSYFYMLQRRLTKQKSLQKKHEVQRVMEPLETWCCYGDEWLSVCFCVCLYVCVSLNNLGGWS